MAPSIFNDVIGPVMRGPSSSHCAAALRIGRLARDLMNGRVESVRVVFNTRGALATTHAGQGTDMGLFGGLLGWEATDARLPRAAQAAREAGLDARIDLADCGDEHPNTYRLELHGGGERHTLKALSTGGGSIRVTEVDGIEVSLEGDAFETFVYVDTGAGRVREFLRERVADGSVTIRGGGGAAVVHVSATGFLAPALEAELRERLGARAICRLSPVLPVPALGDREVPFTTAAGLLAFDGGRGLSLAELARQYESARGGLAGEAVQAMMLAIVHVLRDSLAAGLRGTAYEDRILGAQSAAFAERLRAGRLLGGDGLLNRIVLYVTALMEVKSAMGVIVAAPTAGSCGALPGACLAAAEAVGATEDQTAEAMLAAGVVGLLIAARSTFSAEVAGCQVECGAASGMAAAALAVLGGGTTRQALGAASLALQNSLGMICDPVANRVEVPCLGRNVMAAANALACANMALADFDPVVPLDEVIDALDRVGRALPCELRCTGLGGLSTTPAALRLEQALAARYPM